jgi:TRAP-type C4-dicarboxylate transport system permease small subunit
MKFPELLRRFNAALALLSGVIILIIGILTTMEGIARGLFNAPTTWSLNVAQYLLIWAIFLGSAYAFQEKTHVAVDFIREGVGNRWGKGAQRILSLCGYTFAFVYVAIIAWNSIDMLKLAIKYDTLTLGIVQIPIVWLYLAMLIGSLSMIVTLFFIILDLIGKRKTYI